MNPKKDDIDFNQNEQTKVFVKQLTDLIQAGESGTLKDIAAKLEYNYSALSQIMNGRRNIPSAIYRKFTEVYKTENVMDWKDEKIKLLEQLNHVLKEQLEIKKALEGELDKVNKRLEEFEKRTAASLADYVEFAIEREAQLRTIQISLNEHRHKLEKVSLKQLAFDTHKIFLAELEKASKDRSI